MRDEAGSERRRPGPAGLASDGGESRPPGTTAFVPGHITAFFSAHPADDPSRAGSRGAGFTLSHGVEVRVEPGEGSLSVNGERLTVPPVGRVLDALGVEGRVTAETPLPLGAGFGVSGALALGTALSANAVFECGRSENDLITVAHCAEVESGTGLGDVVAQARGGIPVRLEPGGPAFGALDGVPTPSRVEYLTFGDRSTEAILSEDTTRLSAAGNRALEDLVDSPTLSRLMAASRTFASEADLLTERVAAAVDAVREAGGEASMAMLGETVFALETGLTDAGYDAAACRTYQTGATLLSEE